MTRKDSVRANAGARAAASPSAPAAVSLSAPAAVSPNASAAGFPAWPEGGLARDAFVEQVRTQGVAHYRELPWRHIDDAYAVLVSEIMLQQTQVARVERFWTRFLTAFPTLDALAAAAVSDVLELWQGLGYNRRAIALKRTADECAVRFGGELPRTYDGLVALPGIGPATAAGVLAFAYEEPSVYVETNVRAVFLHDVFPNRESVPDKELVPLVRAVCPSAPAGALVSPAGSADAPDGRTRAFRQIPDPLASPRDWYYALLDYGAHLKATGVNPSRRSAHYARQSMFEGSRRQKRAWIVRRVLAADGACGVAANTVHAELNEAERKSGRDDVDLALFESIVDDLLAEGFFRREGDLLFP